MGMRASQKQWLGKFLAGTSALSMMGMAQVAVAQDAPADSEVNGDEIIVTGIRAPLAPSPDINSEAQGGIAAILAEEIAKFPATNPDDTLTVRKHAVKVKRGPINV